MSVALASGLDIVGDELPVELPDGSQVRFANLDYAATAPCLRAAADAVAALLPWYGSVHRGAGARSARCTTAYERARQSVADFVNARPDDHVIFTRNTTDALNLLARALPAGTVTVTFDGEHHAALLPWPAAVRLPAPADPATAAAVLDAALGRLPAGRLVAVTGASNVTGELWPIADLAAVAHRNGARIVVDAAQLAPHVQVDLAALDVDYLALSGHKLYAPFGTGVLAGRADWLDAAAPYLRGGGASARVGAGIDDLEWVAGPARHEGGTPNLLGAVALGAVCDAIAAADRPALRRAEQELVRRLRAGLADVPAAVELGLFGPDHPRVGIVSVALPGHDATVIADLLGGHYGVGVRAGLFCAHPLTRRLLATADADGGCDSASTTALRASIGLGSTADDVDRFVAALAELTA
jgi:selenocysteine lyase/cysteine desulfurase